MISSWLWHLTRWNGLFLGTYLVTHLGGRPIANQLVGVAMFAPMLLGACVAARTRGDGDPHRVVLLTELALLPVSAMMTVFVAGGSVHLAMVYPFEFAFGIGGMVNMTVQRELLYRLAGPQRSVRLLSTEMAGLASATMLGPLLGGVTIQAFGLGAAFAVPTVLLACSVILMTRVKDRSAVGARQAGQGRQAARTGMAWQLPRRSRALSAILTVTVICNVCYFAFIPLVPVIARNLNAGPAMAGVIGSAAGAVQLVTAAALVVRPLRRPAVLYAGGVALCLCCLGVLSQAPVVAVALLALGAAGVGQALFSATQAILPVAAVGPHDRPAALGLVSTTIGVALPTGMVILGVTSSLLGARRAMLVSALAGLAGLAVTLLRNPHLMRSGEPPGSGAAVRRGGEGDPVAPQPELG
jgi:predicted MFS family arabinose efflux permease